MTRRTARTRPTARAAAAAVAVGVGVLAGACTGDQASAPATAPSPATARSSATTAVAGVTGGPPPSSRRQEVRNDQPWPMHAVDSRFRGANALGRADVDGDGRDDYVTNYEFDQRAVISFAPPAGADPTRPWPTMTWFCPTADPATKGCDTESASLADLDGDGNLDIVISQGGH